MDDLQVEFLKLAAAIRTNAVARRRWFFFERRSYLIQEMLVVGY